MSAERNSNDTPLPFQAPPPPPPSQNQLQPNNNSRTNVRVASEQQLSSTANPNNATNESTGNNPNNPNTPPAPSPSQSRPGTSNNSNIYPLRESAFGPPLSSATAAAARNTEPLPPLTHRATLPQPPPFPHTHIAAQPAARPAYSSSNPQPTAVYTAAPSQGPNRLAPHPEPSSAQQTTATDQPTQQPPQPPTSAAENTAAPSPSRAALPMGLTLQTASSRILQSVHSLQRMPHGAPPNPHLSCNLLLPEGRPLSLNSIHAPNVSVPDQHAAAAAAAAAVGNIERENVLHSQQDYRPVAQQQRDARHMTPRQHHQSSDYAAQQVQQPNASKLENAPVAQHGPGVYNVGQQPKNVNQQIGGVQHVREPQQQISEVAMAGASKTSPINPAAGASRTTVAAQPSGAASVTPSRGDTGDKRNAAEIQPNSSKPMEAQEAERKPTSVGVVEVNGNAHGEEVGQRRQLKVEDALAYLEKVKVVFGNQPNVYNNFLDIMKAFKAQTIDTIEVIVRVSQLFTGHDQLILGFNRFLPPGYKIQIVQDEKTGVFTAGFEGPKGYSQLNPASNPLHLKPIAPHPSAGAGSSAQPVLANSERVTPQNQRQPVSPAATADRLSASAQPNSPRSPNRRNNVPTPPPLANAEDEDTLMVDPASPTVPHSGNVGPSEPSREQMTDGFRVAITLLQDLTTRSNGNELLGSFIELTNKFKDGKGCEKKKASELSAAAAELLKEHKDLLARFHQFLPVFYPVTSNGNIASTVAIPERTDGRRGPRRRSMPNQPPEVNAFKRIRDVLGSRRQNVYNEFLKMVSLLTHEIVSRDEFRAIIDEMFKTCPQALDIFNECLANAMSPDYGSDADEDYDSASEPEEDIDIDPAKLAEYKTKSMSEVAQESTNIVGASYRTLPKGYPQPVCSGRSALERATLNDLWVSVTQGSEDYTKFFMRKNTFEDNLYRCEDDRYELDMIIETNSSTIMALEPIAATISRLPSDSRAMHALVDGALNRIHYNAIQRIYGDKGSEVVMQVKLNPYAAIPVVLARLKEKDAHWRRSRNDMNRVWRDVGEKNYYRGVDHRSVLFKAADKKELSTKTLLADVIDPTSSSQARDAEYQRARGYALVTSGGKDGVVNDRSRAVEAVIKAAAAGAPHILYLQYDDDTVHRVAYDLVKMQVQKDVHDSGAARHVIKCFRKLISSFFNVSLDDEDGNRRDNSDTPAVVFADETVYLMFRLYDILYERLAKAKKLSESNAADQRYRDEMNVKGRKRVKGKTHIPECETHPSELVQAFTPTNATKYFSVQRLPTDGSEIFSEFLSHFKMFLTKTLNCEQYEDKCRVLLGPMSFLMFTLDKTLSKTATHVVKSCGSESISRPFIDLYHETKSRYRGAMKNGGDETIRGFEELHCSAAANHLRKEKGASSMLFRLQFVKRQSNDGLLAVSAFGRTASDEDEKIRVAVAEKLDAFLGFAGSCDAAVAAKNRKNDEAKEMNGRDADGGERKEKEGGNGKKRKSGSKEKDGLRKRARNVSSPIPTYQKRHVDMEKVRDKDLVVNNGLEMKLGRAGFVYISGSGDFMVNRSRRWKRVQGEKKMGGDIKYRDEKIASIFRDKSNDDVNMATTAMDENRTESSSGSTPQSEVDEKKSVDPMEDDEVAGETAEESEGEINKTRSSTSGGAKKKDGKASVDLGREAQKKRSKGGE